MWLLERLDASFKNAKHSYVAANPDVLHKKILSDANHVPVGVGRGAFDEHKGDIGDSAASLVWKFLKKKGLKMTVLEIAAMDELVEWVKIGDQGKLTGQVFQEFLPHVPITYIPKMKGKNSDDATVFGYLYLDGIFEGLKEKHLLLKDWKHRLTFQTRWGRGVAVESAVSSDIVGRQALLTGHVIYIIVNPQSKFRSARASAKSRVDFTRAYEKMKTLEPKAEWYLHHSKKLLICGSTVAANVYLSKIPLKTLAEIVKKS